MRGSTTTTRRRRKAARIGGRNGRPGWYRVRVDTEGGAYLGSLRLDAEGLRPVIDGERAYLPLWNAAREGSSAVEEFVALHKAAIRSVVVVEEDRAAGGTVQEW